jgi:flavin reductase (DIM6/NTAB) family NADH-FMN oxidoreductase RutF
MIIMNTNLQKISIRSFISKSFDLWDKTWLLLTSGNFSTGEFNSMTVAWGGFGIMWNKPMAMVVVRPTRHTFTLINSFDTFSLCVFPEKHRSALNLLGTKSGRDGDKIKESGLTPIASSVIAAPVFKEAELMIECRKIYWDDLDPQHFLDLSIEKNYVKKDYHRMVIGEVIKIIGDKQKYFNVP